jgi:pimeloyl-ACP methyl ester carboxylesterase
MDRLSTGAARPENRGLPCPQTTYRHRRSTDSSKRDAHARGDEEALREVMRHNLLTHMLAGTHADDLALNIHTRSCLATRFHSKAISRLRGLGECLRRFEGPLLLVWGEHDVTATPAQLAPTLVECCVDGHAEVIDGAAHWVQYQAAVRVDALLLDWFGGMA